MLLLAGGMASAQKFEPGKVTTAELQQSVYAADTTASAAILYKKGRSFFKYDHNKGFSLVHEYQYRIKIYKKEGLRWADFKVPYFIGYQTLANDRVAFTNAVTYNLENGQLVKTKLSGEGKFKQEVNEFWGEASIAMPNVKPGSVIEFTYTLKSEDIGDFPVFNFQEDIPVAHAAYMTEIPQFYRYKPTKTGFGTVKSEGKVANGFQNYVNEYKQTLNMSYQQINTSYIAENVPALKEEPYVDNIDNYRLAVQHELEKTVNSDGLEKNYAATWEGVAQTIFKEDKFGKELKERSYFEPFLEPILKNATTDAQKATAIFDFVKRTITWNGQYGYLTRKGVRKAFDEKSGNVAEVNFLLIAMLNYSGIKADPVLLSTVKHGIPVYPTRTIFNYVIAAIALDGKTVLLDATDKNATLGILPLRDLNWTGRLIKPDGTSTEINLVPETASKETVNMMAKIESDGKATGKVRMVKTDYNAFWFRDQHGQQAPAQYQEWLENQYGGIEIYELVPDRSTDLSKPVAETFNFAAQSEVIGDKIFVNPMLFYAADKNPFVLENRELPIYYGYPFQKKYNISLEIPEGYVVESLPKSIKLTTGENVGNFTFNISSAENKIQLSVSQEINLAIISGNFYGSLKEFYQQMVVKQNEKIVLKKI
jgi:Domain of Unknown Function with PDB structure (DUF3857)